MHSVQEDMEVFRGQLEQGSVQRAYRALLSYMMSLRTHFKKSYGESAVSALYPGYMDMTYFAVFPSSLRHRGLKIAIVFNYNEFRFEAWLAGSNRPVQRQYWELFRSGEWAGYRLVTPAKGIDSIVECDLAKDFDLSDPGALTSRIETGTAAFIGDVEKFLAACLPAEEAWPPGEAIP